MHEDLRRCTGALDFSCVVEDPETLVAARFVHLHSVFVWWRVEWICYEPNVNYERWEGGACVVACKR